MTPSHWILGSTVILGSVPLYNNIISTYLLCTGFAVMHTPYNLKFITCCIVKYSHQANSHKHIIPYRSLIIIIVSCVVKNIHNYIIYYNYSLYINIKWVFQWNVYCIVTCGHNHIIYYHRPRSNYQK